MKFAFIPCQNGLGHTVRLLNLAKFFSKKGHKIDFYLNKKKKYKINFSNICVKYMNIPTKLYDYENSLYVKKISKIKLPRKYDFYVSDNLFEFFKIPKNFILIANFFWHKIFLNKISNYKLLELKKKKNLILSNYLFSNLKINKIKYNLKLTGFVGKFEKKKLFNQKSILLTNGTASPEIEMIIKIIEKINSSKINIKRIYVDKKVYNYAKYFFGNLELANYDQKMFKDIFCAIIRPGLGTITDCLRFSVPILALNYGLNIKNKELKFNIKIIKSYDFGIEVKNIKEIVSEIYSIMKLSRYKKNFFLKCKSLRWEAEKDIYNYVIRSDN